MLAPFRCTMKYRDGKTHKCVTTDRTFEGAVEFGRALLNTNVNLELPASLRVGCVDVHDATGLLVATLYAPPTDAK